MFRLGMSCLLSCCAAMLGGCGDSTPKSKPVTVNGMVKIDGKPVSDGEITFTLTGEPPLNFAIKEGSYSGAAHVGSNKVEIRAYKAAPPNPNDPTKMASRVNYALDKYGSQSKLTADVAVSGANEFKFDVTSK